MTLTPPLGGQIRTIEIDGTKFYVRGLTVGEYTDLSMQNLLNGSEKMFFTIGVTGLVGWENMFVQGDDGGITEVEFSAHLVQSLPEDIVVQIGEYIYNHLTTLSSEEEQKFRGYIRFLLWLSDEKNKSQAKTFNCETCIMSGQVYKRNCSRYTPEQIEDMRLRGSSGGEEGVSAKHEAQPTGKASERYRMRRTTLNPPKNLVDSKPDTPGAPEKPKRAIRINKFEFPECPISWVDDWIKNLSGIMYHAEKSNIPLFSGGIFDQPYKMYQASKAVIGEANQIEHEEFEEKNKTNK